MIPPYVGFNILTENMFWFPKVARLYFTKENTFENCCPSPDCQNVKNREIVSFLLVKLALVISEVTNIFICKKYVILIVVISM